MLEQLTRLKNIADNIRSGAKRTAIDASADAHALDVIVDAIQDAADEQTQEADNLDLQLNELQEYVPESVRASYSDVLQRSFDITNEMQQNNTKLANTTSEANNTRTFNGDSDIKIIPKNMLCAANMSGCLQGSGVQIIFDLPDMADCTNASSAFRLCAQLTHIDAHNFFTGGKVTNISTMCRESKNLQYLDMRNWDLSVCTNVTQAFRDSLSLKIDLPDTDSNDPQAVQGTGWKKLSLPAATDVRGMFWHVSRLPQKLYVSLKNASGYEFAVFLRGSGYTDTRNTLEELYLDCTNATCNWYTDGSAESGSLVGYRKGFKKAALVSTAGVKQMNEWFADSRDLTDITGLDFSGLYLSKNEIKSFSGYANQTAAQLSTLFGRIVNNTFLRCYALVNCEITGTIYKSGINLSDCENLSKASLLSFLNALYDWDTNSESKTTDDTVHIFTIGQKLYNKYVYSESADYDEDVEDAIDEATLKGWDIVPSEYEAI